jgi:ATP-binding cassette subfamily C protein
MDNTQQNINDPEFQDAMFKNLGALLSDDSSVNRSEFTNTEDALSRILYRAAKRMNIEPRFTSEWDTINTVTEKLEFFCLESNCAYRELNLIGDWSRGDFGTVIYFDESNSPYLIESSKKKHCVVYNGGDNYSNSTVRCSIESVTGAAKIAIMLIPTLPNKTLKFRDILEFTYKSNKREFKRIWFLSALAGLIAMLFPIAVGILFGNVIPSANKGLLFQIGLALLVITIAKELFRLSNNLLTIRLEGWIHWNLQYAIMERLMKLPISFFRAENSGALANKIMSFKEVNYFLTSGLSQIVFALFYAFFNLILLYFFDIYFAIIITLFSSLYIAVLLYNLRNEIRKNQKIQEERIWLDSMVLQFVKGLNKIKQAAAEGQIIVFWSHYYALLVKRIKRKPDNKIIYELLAQNVTWVAQAILFALFLIGTVEVSTGAFLGLNAAFFNLFISIGLMAGIMKQLNHVLPAYQNVKPVFDTIPEVDNLNERIQINGNITIDKVSFRYDPNGPLILNDLTISIKSGESIALVGPSGSGKSTVLRLLLGFESPQTGGVFYDDKEIESIDLRFLRKQFGVVLQNDNLMAGTIFENIAGTQNITLEEAWRAAENASVKADIEEMPMGMHTLISDHVSTISGGQKQRILIARALAGRPKILYLDESTSALDNISQKVVTDSLESLEVTRIIVAHRLSTIMNVDRILYLESGKLVESGSYKELMELNGKFKKLAERQLS